jgi:lipopolysaccharide export system permease protein
MNPVNPALSGRRVYLPSTFHYDSPAVKIVDRYVLRELLVPFFLGIAVFTSILLIVRILKLVEMVVSRGVPFLQMLRLFSYILPGFLEVTLPMALLLAILVGFGRLSSDSELIAMRASGISLYRMMYPVGIFAVATALVTLSLSIYARPWGNTLMRTGLYDIVKAKASAGIKPKVFNDEFTDLVIYVDRIEPGGDLLHGILISDTRGDASDLRNTVYARSGVLRVAEDGQMLTLRLSDGGIFSAAPQEAGFQDTTFHTYDITLDLSLALGELRRKPREASEMSLIELRRAIREMGLTQTPSFVEQVELHRKFSIPFACLVFAALGVPLGIQPTRAVHSRGFSVSLVLIFLYYLLLSLGQNLGERGSVHPVLAIWLPNVTLSSVAAILLSRAARDMTTGRPTWVGRLIQRVRPRSPGRASAA